MVILPNNTQLNRMDDFVGYRKAILWIKKRKFHTKYDFNTLTSGTSKELGLHSQTVQAIGEEYAVRRSQFRKPFLRWRSAKRNLGWIPFKKSGVKICGDEVTYCGKTFRFWKSRELPSEVRSGNFSQDSLGRWYVNCVCEANESPSLGTEELGIDLGLKDLGVLSNGERIENPRWYRKIERRIATQQKLRHAKRVKRLHAKVKNQRKDFLHKVSTNLVERSSFIAVGNVRSSKLGKTKMAKSIFDAGWSLFRGLLKYKSLAKQVTYLEVSEDFTTQTCSSCEARSGPRGREGLGIREWVCWVCGAHHDRDVNSAVNILRCGRAALRAKSAVGISVL